MMQEKLAEALRLAEKAHAKAVKAGLTDQWPEFYAKWLIDNAVIWIGRDDS